MLCEKSNKLRHFADKWMNLMVILPPNSDSKFYLRRKKLKALPSSLDYNAPLFLFIQFLKFSKVSACS
ncbi:MAG: hypothetical protein CRN43_12960 [Candidatus Nephrothrix sp. EaCA]|nr:MAG: hypothetical protein CRN43_12960 [Candidatus Nephrothrix sp. EaCA]